MHCEALNSLVQFFPNHRSPLGNLSNQTRSRGQEAFLHPAHFISSSSFHLLVITSSCQTPHNSSVSLSCFHVSYGPLYSFIFHPFPTPYSGCTHLVLPILPAVLLTAPLLNRRTPNWTDNPQTLIFGSVLMQRHENQLLNHLEQQSESSKP